MRPVYVCQLPKELQREIEDILTRLLLYQCGGKDKAEDYFGMSLADAVQLGMESKIADIDCAAEPLKSGGGMADMPERIRKDVERLSEIMTQRTEMETEAPFLFLTGEQVGEGDYYELVNVIWHHGEDDYGLWQVQIPLYLVRNILNSPQNFVGDLDEVMDSVPLEPWPPDNTLHFLFPRGGRIVCCSMEMEEKFFAEYSIQGSSVRGSRDEIREELTILLSAEQAEESEEAER